MRWRMGVRSGADWSIRSDFLVLSAGQMDKESFTAAATATDLSTDFCLDCSIQEIEITGDYAWVVATLLLSI